MPDPMQQEKGMVGKTTLPGGVQLSRIVYGMWRLADQPDTSPESVRTKIEICLDQGITTIDHADIYGGYQVEEIFGNALRGSGLRERIEIVTKCGIIYPAGRHAGAAGKYYDTSAAHLFASVEHSLRLMHTDHIDVLLIHRPDPMMDHLETGAALDRLVQQGKVRAVGMSNFRPWDHALLQSAMNTTLAANQIELSLVRHQALTNGDVPYFQQRDIPLMAWSPLGGGRLMESGRSPLGDALDKVAHATGTSRAAVAAAWLLAHPARIMPVLGTNNLERIRILAEACRLTLDRAAWFALYAAALGTDIP